jgi:hypothetical protein
MQLKKESRILIVDRINNVVVGVVLRGIVGIEDIVVFSDCNHLINF